MANPTPQQTIGVNHGVEVVKPVKPVVDKIADPEEADTTTVNFGQPEPGHDIFAGKDADKPKSDSAMQQQNKLAEAVSVVQNQTEKDVSVVQPPPVQEDVTPSELFSSAPASSEAVSKEDVQSTEAESSVAVAESASTAAASSVAESESTAAALSVAEKAVGAMDEAEAEAERARNELFPDADA